MDLSSLRSISYEGMRARPSLTISVADYFQSYQHGQKFTSKYERNSQSCQFLPFYVCIISLYASTNHETTGTKVMAE